jgi:hypothetical protein
MSEKGQTRPWDRNGARSVHLLIADLRQQHRHDRSVPRSRRCTRAKVALANAH